MLVLTPKFLSDDTTSVVYLVLSRVMRSDTFLWQIDPVGDVMTVKVREKFISFGLLTHERFGDRSRHNTFQLVTRAL